MTNCPCFSGKTYNECCEPVINNKSASTALALMRSRYTAFYNGQAEYLYKTTHSTIKGQNKLSDIEKSCKENTWTKLEIISVEHGNIKDTRGLVEFKAYFKDKDEKDQVLHERSNFIKEDGKWFYCEGVVNPPKIDLMQKVSRNDPCPCGSGKKHKKCCL